tara:strand:+ start:253 stop:744 length:492 start_codon:yes stop_codon:yes gene_type:complete
MAHGKREEKSTLGKIADKAGDFFGSMANDFAIGVGLKDDPGPTPRDDMAGRHSSYQRRTEATMDREKKRNAASGESTSPAQAAAAQLAQANRNLLAQSRARSIGAIGAAPSVPDPNAIGETEQALLDQQKKGRSSTISTSATGLLSDEDDTRKKRSLMGGLIS